MEAEVVGIVARFSAVLDNSVISEICLHGVWSPESGAGVVFDQRSLEHVHCSHYYCS